jgi:UDP-GlcNAc:undecaprenyl-phosphate GlcNAc-1-phosphate transferase
VTAIATAGLLAIAVIIAFRNIETGPAAYLFADPVRLVMIAAMLGTLLGFLPFNFHPARIFMGDAGSLLIGYFCVAAILLLANGQPQGLKLATAGLMTFGLPVVDTTLAVARRLYRRQSLMSPDRDHVHHLLRRAGFSVRQTVLILYAATGVFAAIAVTLIAVQATWPTMITTGLVLYAAAAIPAFWYGNRPHKAENADPQHPATRPADPAADDEPPKPALTLDAAERSTTP